jgi:hypothetical protein
MFPVRYELNSYILFRRNSVFKGLRTSGDTVLGRKLGTKRVEAGEKLYKEELHNLHCSPRSTIRVTRWAEHISEMGE